MIKVVQFQYSFTSAGKQGVRLHNAFLENGIDSTLITLYSDIAANDKLLGLGKSYKMIASLDKMIQKYLVRKSIKKFGLFSYPVFGSNVSKLDQVKQADIIYLHWVLGGFLSLNSIKQLAKLKKPIIIVLHDMWPITGGCHHSFTCDKYKDKCNNCQMFPGQKKNDLSAKEFKRKLKLFSKYNNFYFVSPSKWLYDCAKQSALTKNKPIFNIPNIIDRNIYKPFGKATAKNALNLSESEIIVGFGVVSINSPYKGWSYLKSALEILHEKYQAHKISILIFGANSNPEIVKEIPYRTKFLGYLRDDYSMSLVYNAIDVFVVPSLADNLPTTIFESMSCGTPVVAFETGGIPDFFEHKLNGYLAKYKDAEDLANGIIFCIKNSLKGYVLKGFDMSLVIKKHLELFEKIGINKC